MLRLTIVDVADHIERFKALYQLALRDAADAAVYAALVRHFTDYALSFIARSDNPDLPEANRQVVAEFVANGFAGAIKAWLGDDAVTKEDLVDAAFRVRTRLVELTIDGPVRSDQGHAVLLSDDTVRRLASTSPWKVFRVSTVMCGSPRGGTRRQGPDGTDANRARLEPWRRLCPD